MRLLVGLGNPGPKYATTRHNFGFLLLDRVFDYLRKERKLSPVARGQVEGFARWETFQIEEEALTLFWPLTYMNLSGQAVAQWTEMKLVETEFSSSRDLLVAFDDLSLPLGRVRVRAKGSSGGHNGLKSMQACLGHEEYPRIKLGIGRPADSAGIIDYVLCPFSDIELRTVDRVLDFCIGPVLAWVSGREIESLAQVVNGWRAPEQEEPEVSKKV